MTSISNTNYLQLISEIGLVEVLKTSNIYGYSSPKKTVLLHTIPKEYVKRLLDGAPETYTSEWETNHRLTLGKGTKHSFNVDGWVKNGRGEINEDL